MFCQTILFSLAITVAAFPMRAFISTASDRLLEMLGLLGAVLNSPLVEYFILSFLHPKKQADGGRSAPYWLGADQLWQAVAV